MTEHDVNEFIRQMGLIGDVWEAEDVECVYGNYRLEDAVRERTAAVERFAAVINGESQA